MAPFVDFDEGRYALERCKWYGERLQEEGYTTEVIEIGHERTAVVATK